jgi:preprotein translocase subunit SecD
MTDGSLKRPENNMPFRAFRRMLSLMVGLVLASCGGSRDATSSNPVPNVDLTIRAASRDPVPGWLQMQSVGNNPETLWVAPEPALTLADVESAKATVDESGRPAIDLRFSSSGGERLQTFSAAQIGKDIAIVLEGKVLSAPRVQSQIRDRAIVTGVGQDDIDRILVSVNRR